MSRRGSQATCTVLATLALVAGLFSATAGADPAPERHGAHAAGSTCPDPDDEGDPCDPGCSCTCCPGHTVAATAVARALEIGPPLRRGVVLRDDRGLHPQDVHSRIFHPPRA